MIKMILVKDGEPTIIETEQSFKTLYGILDCKTIQAISIGFGYSLLCDEEGIWSKKPFNCCGILGPFLLVGRVKKGFFTTLNDEEVILLTNFVQENKNNKSISRMDI